MGLLASRRGASSQSDPSSTECWRADPLLPPVLAPPTPAPGALAALPPPAMPGGLGVATASSAGPGDGEIPCCVDKLGGETPRWGASHKALLSVVGAVALGVEALPHDRALKWSEWTGDMSLPARCDASVVVRSDPQFANGGMGAVSLAWSLALIRICDSSAPASAARSTSPRSSCSRSSLSATRISRTTSNGAAAVDRGGEHRATP